MTSSTGRDRLMGFVFFVGVTNGILPLILRPFRARPLLLSLPTRLDAPWWWIASLAVIVVSVALLVVIGNRD